MDKGSSIKDRLHATEKLHLEIPSPAKWAVTVLSYITKDDNCVHLCGLF